MDLMEIKGKVNTAICYARVVEDEAIEQIRRMCDYAMTEGSRIRIMPDVHAGKGCTIGTTMTITDKAVPNVVGVDIGCGMYTVNLGKADVDFEKVENEQALEEISKQFPAYRKVKVQEGFMQIFEKHLGVVESVDGDICQVRYWEFLITARILSGSTLYFDTRCAIL